jgi:uncharacterized YigZ family protein
MINIRRDDGDSPAARDAYRTIEGSHEAEIKILGSRFLAYARGIERAQEAEAFLDALRREHHAATHHCYAWRLGIDGQPSRFSDDGEPNGTAGPRILGALERRALSDAAVVVVRYFGGTKLGMGGLAHAYTDAADAVLDRAAPVERILYDTFALRFGYDLTAQAHHVLERCGADILDRGYEADVRYLVRIRRSQSAALTRLLAEYTNNAMTIEQEPL